MKGNLTRANSDRPLGLNPTEVRRLYIAGIFLWFLCIFEFDHYGIDSPAS